MTLFKSITTSNFNALFKGIYLKKKTLWPLFMDGVQLPQG